MRQTKEQEIRSIPGKGHKYVFQSVVKRTQGAAIKPPYNSF